MGLCTKSAYERVNVTQLQGNVISLRGHPYMMSAKFWDYSPKPLLDQRRWRRVGTRLPPGILVDEIRSHQLLGDKSYFVPKFQEGYAYNTPREA